MASVFDNAVKGYTIGLNNKLNAQKAYIASYLDGINARNSINGEARQQDQYYNYTQPLQASNLGVSLGQNSIQQRILDNPSYQSDLFGVAMAKANQSNQLAQADLKNSGFYIDTQGNLAKTGAITSGYNMEDARFNRGQQAEVNKQRAASIAQDGSMQSLQNKIEQTKANALYQSLISPPAANQAMIAGTPASGLKSSVNGDDGSAKFAVQRAMDIQNGGGSAKDLKQWMLTAYNRGAIPQGASRTSAPNAQSVNVASPSVAQSSVAAPTPTPEQNYANAVASQQAAIDKRISELRYIAANGTITQRAQANQELYNLSPTVRKTQIPASYISDLATILGNINPNGVFGGGDSTGKTD